MISEVVFLIGSVTKKRNGVNVKETTSHRQIKMTLNKTSRGSQYGLQHSEAPLTIWQALNGPGKVKKVNKSVEKTRAYILQN